MTEYSAFYEMNMKKSADERQQMVIENSRRLDKARKGQLKTAGLFVVLCLIFDFQFWIAFLCLGIFFCYTVIADGCMECPICGKRFPGPRNSRLFLPEKCIYCGTNLRDD